MPSDTHTKSGSGINIPSEYRLSHKWSNALERFGFNIAVGSAVGLGVSLVLFRGRSLKIASTVFGAGFGAGDAFRQSTNDFLKERQ